MSEYTGIGSRKAPLEVLHLFSDVGMQLAEKGFRLRSGHAKGCDDSFEKGCDSVLGDMDIFIPWSRFNGSVSDLIVSDHKAFEIAEKYHPKWEALTEEGKKLMARNSHQILGRDLNSPTKFVICWTVGGKGTGGTGQALRIAKDYNIPIYDCGGYEIEDFKKLLNEKLGLRL